MDKPMNATVQVPTKICNKCNQPHPATKFKAIHKRTLIDGTVAQYRLNTCKKCVKEQRRDDGKCPYCNQPQPGEVCTFCSEKEVVKAQFAAPRNPVEY